MVQSLYFAEICLRNSVLDWLTPHSFAGTICYFTHVTKKLINIAIQLRKTTPVYREPK